MKRKRVEGEEREGERGREAKGNNDYTVFWYQFVPGHDGT